LFLQIGAVDCGCGKTLSSPEYFNLSKYLSTSADFLAQHHTSD